MTRNIKIGDEYFVPAGEDRWYIRTTGSNWKKVVVKSETKVSWVVGTSGHELGDFKVPKRDPKLLRTEEQTQQEDWVDAHSYRIIDRLRYNRDLSYSDWRKIAELVNYNDQPDKERP